MADNATDPPEGSFEARLARARRDREAAEAPRRNPSSSALGIAMRVSVEIVAGVAVGAVIGWGLDRLLGTKPWLLLVFFMLGTAAGFLNVKRAIDALNRQSMNDASDSDKHSAEAKKPERDKERDKRGEPS